MIIKLEELEIEKSVISKNQLNFCPICKKYVEIKRKPFKDSVILIWTILLIVTLGLATPVLIYLYLRRKKNRCKKCNNIVVIIPSGQDLTKTLELPKEMYSVPTEETHKGPVESEMETTEKIIEPKQAQENPQIKNAVIFFRRIAFCPFCGSKISDEGQELCSSCGADLNEGD